MAVKENFNFFRLNISSLPYYFLELHTLLATSKIELEIIDMTKSRLEVTKAI